MTRVWKLTSPVLAAALAAILLTTVGAVHKPPPDPALSLLRRVLSAEDRVPYEGKQTVVLSTDHGTDATITQELHGGPGRSRTECLMPKRAAGRLVIRDGQWHWDYDAKRKVAVRSSLARKPAAADQATAALACLTKSYRARLDKKLAMVNNRPAYVLRLDPVRKDRPRRVWWVDKTTAFVLRREVYEVDGTLDQVTSFSNLSLRPKVDARSFVFHPPAGVRVVRQSQPQSFTSLPEARKNLPRWANLPADLGGGFEFESARMVRVSAAQGVQAQYSDGLLGISLFQIPGNLAFPSGAHTVRDVRVGSSPGKILQLVAPYRILAWRSRGTTYHLVADLSSSVMLQIARAL
jgi:outer membrane lipoprotein-sorting protein